MTKARRIAGDFDASSGFAGKILGCELLDRITRIGDCFDASVKDFQDASVAPTWIGPEAVAIDSGLTLQMVHSSTSQYAKVLGTLTIDRSAEISAFKAFVALWEYDLVDKYNKVQKVHPDVPMSRRLWPITGDQASTSVGDSLWHVVRQPQRGGKQDNVFHVSCVDALDEPLNALWCAIYTPDQSHPRCRTESSDVELDHGSVEGPGELCGVKLPPAEEGSLRLVDERTVFIIQPHLEGGGFELKWLISSRLSRAAQMFPGILTIDLKRKVQDFIQFVHSEEGDKELKRRIYLSEHQKLYRSIRRHLEKVTNGTVDFLQQSSAISSFEDLSCRLPDDWADRTELNEEGQHPIKADASSNERGSSDSEDSST
jgi:hypothetical protein